jgi:hypothetical protein
LVEEIESLVGQLTVNRRKSNLGVSKTGSIIRSPKKRKQAAALSASTNLRDIQRQPWSLDKSMGEAD